MNDSQKTLLVLLIFLVGFCAVVVFLDGYAQGQTTTTQKVAEVQQQVASNEVQLDTTTIGAGIGTAAGVIAVVKGLLDQRKNTARDRTTDVDAGRFIILISKFYQAKYLYPHMTDKEILDLPISNNPMSKMTLGQAITSEAELWANGNQQYWGIPSPQMSVPSMTTVEAVKTKDSYPTVVAVADTSKKAPPPPPPPPPAAPPAPGTPPK